MSEERCLRGSSMFLSSEKRKKERESKRGRKGRRKKERKRESERERKQEGKKQGVRNQQGAPPFCLALSRLSRPSRYASRTFERASLNFEKKKKRQFLPRAVKEHPRDSGIEGDADGQLDQPRRAEEGPGGRHSEMKGEGRKRRPVFLRERERESIDERAEKRRANPNSLPCHPFSSLQNAHRAIEQSEFVIPEESGRKRRLLVGARQPQEIGTFSSAIGR